MIWGNSDYFIGRSMDVFIARLRKYLKADPNVKILTVHGVGFRLVITEPVAVE
jgi:DNA-binding response OmpR family regulator